MAPDFLQFMAVDKNNVRRSMIHRLPLPARPAVAAHFWKTSEIIAIAKSNDLFTTRHLGESPRPVLRLAKRKELHFGPVLERGKVKIAEMTVLATSNRTKLFAAGIGSEIC